MSFELNLNGKGARLSACFWTNCYEGKASVLMGKRTGSLTAIGKLLPSTHHGNEPVIVSLTVDPKGKFTAVWGYGGESLTFDMGSCEVLR